MFPIRLCHAVPICFLLVGCAALSRNATTENNDALARSFADGTITLGGYRFIQSGLVEEKQKIYDMYRAADWDGLMSVVVKSDWGLDLYWFYLGRSAEAERFPFAARKYYENALTTQYKCRDLRIVPQPVGMDNCDGLRFPDVVYFRLRLIEQRTP